MEYGIFLLCSTAALLGTLVGFGGGIFVVPAMVLGFGIPIEVAIGVTAMSLFPSSLISSLGNLRNKNIDFRLLFALEPFTMVGAFGGAFLTSLLPSGPLKVIFGLFLILMSFKMGAKKKSSESSETSELPPKPWIRGFRKLNELKPVIHGPGYSVGLWAASVFGMLAGVIAGLFGIGGGVLKTPLMLNVFKVPVRTATATSLAMIMVTSLISGTTHFQLGHYSYPVLIPAVLGFVTGAVIGLWVGVKLTDQMIRKAISVTLFLAGVATFAHTLM